MKFIYLLFIGVTGAGFVQAQTFQKKLSWKDNSIAMPTTAWVDLNNDSLLDVVVAGSDVVGKVKVSFFKNISAQNFVEQPPLVENITFTDLFFTDLNRDNRIDIVIVGTSSGKSSTISFINNGNFSFERQESTLPKSFLVRFGDLDQDGQEDLVSADATGWQVFKKGLSGYVLKLDSTGITRDIGIRDFDRDGKNDIVISGNNVAGAPFLTFLKNKGGFRFEKINIINPVAGSITTGDFNYDGQFDFIVSGKNKSTQAQIKYFQKDSVAFVAADSVSGHETANLLLADFDSDGLADLSFSGADPSGKHYNAIRKQNGTLIALDTLGLIHQKWGDFDRDGDLDMLRVLDSASSSIIYLLFCFSTTKLDSIPCSTLSKKAAPPGGRCLPLSCRK